METDYLPYPLVITWEAERAVWRHECLRTFPLSTKSAGQPVVSESSSDTGAGELPDGYVFGLGSAVDTKVDNPGMPQSVGSDFDVGNASGDEFFTDDETCHRYLDKWWGGSSSTSRSASVVPDMEKGIIEFLRKLYLRLDEEHRQNRVLERLRGEFRDAHSVYVGSALDIGMPNGNVVYNILQCMKDVQETGLCDEIDCSLRFWFDWNDLSVWTTCTILVPADQEIRIKRTLPMWQFGSSEFLIVEISTARLEKFR
ncbi:hypothetical protein VNI00_018041 [Paramarasmius palmivorus]|uniref:Uncharacterized protein n=1 Tax=Paramarasmius palmivorus TaxID=297713 RepID=A0AAW0B1A7_9AGAR